jgi:hypothetical protein
MAEIQADNYAKSANPSQSNRNDPGAVGGRVRSLTDVVTLAAAQIGDTIPLGKDLQAGAIIHGVEIYNANLGALVTLDVGDSDTADRYYSAIVGSAITVSKDIAQGQVGYVIGTNSGDGTIQITIAGAAATGEIKAIIYYSED